MITPELTLFHTDSLRVRRLAACDLDAMCSVYGDADTMRWVGDAQPLSRHACVEWLAVTDRNYTTRGYLPSRKREARSHCNRRLVRLLQLLRFISTYVGDVTRNVSIHARAVKRARRTTVIAAAHPMMFQSTRAL